MAKSVNPTILDQALSYVKTHGSSLCVCSAQPFSYAQAITNYMLAIHTGMSSGDFTGPADDGSGGRKLQINQQSGVPVTNGGTALFVALVDDGLSALLLVTTCTSQVLTAGNTVTIPVWNYDIAAP